MPVIIDGTNGITQAGEFNSDSSFGFKNRIINGAMIIDQRNAGASVTPTNGQYLVDRWYAGLTQSSKFSAQQDSGAVTPPVGFIDYLGCTSLSSYSVSSGDAFFVQQCIEGLNVSDLGWGTANAKSVTISFWVRSSLTGTFGGSVMNSAVNRAYPFSFTINSANTWENKSITISGDTTGTWLTTNGIGLRLTFSLGMGSTLSNTAGAWAAGNFLSATGATSVVGTNGATFYITGVQLETGSTATSFEYRQYGTELALCQRYYEKSTALTGFAGARGLIAWATTAAQGFYFVVTKRATPTVTVYSRSGTINTLSSSSSGSDSATATANGITSSGVQSVGSTGLTTGIQYEANYAASAEL
jgi:hypothetical protein